MLKLKNFTLSGKILSMVLLVEGDETKAYKLSVNIKTEFFDVVQSEVPEKYKSYINQAQIALVKYRGKELPDVITSMWY